MDKITETKIAKISDDNNETIGITKICKACNLPKPLSEYHKQAAAKDGYTTKCKTCCKAAYKSTNQINKRLQWALENPNTEQGRRWLCIYGAKDAHTKNLVEMVRPSDLVLPWEKN